MCWWSVETRYRTGRKLVSRTRKPTVRRKILRLYTVRFRSFGNTPIGREKIELLCGMRKNKQSRFSLCFLVLSHWLYKCRIGCDEGEKQSGKSSHRWIERCHVGEKGWESRPCDHKTLSLTHSQLSLTHSQLPLTHSRLPLTHSHLSRTHTQLSLTSISVSTKGLQGSHEIKLSFHKTMPNLHERSHTSHKMNFTSHEMKVTYPQNEGHVSTKWNLPLTKQPKSTH